MPSHTRDRSLPPSQGHLSEKAAATRSRALLGGSSEIPARIVPIKSKIVLVDSEIVSVKSGIVSVESRMVPTESRSVSE
jgi:hypothetical protein